MINKIKNNKLLMQIIKFLVVGGIAFIKKAVVTDMLSLYWEYPFK